MNAMLFVLCALVSTHITYFFTHTKAMNPVRASTLPTLFFVALTTPFRPSGLPILLLQAAFFGASFVGMSHPTRLGEKQVLCAGALFGLLFYFIAQLKSGFGGTLGSTAFASCLIITVLDWRGRGVKRVSR